jgi:hypothetical protein
VLPLAGFERLCSDSRADGCRRLQFRAEFFNVLNHANFGLPNASVGSAAYATISTVVTNARQVQFALRLHW